MFKRLKLSVALAAAGFSSLSGAQSTPVTQTLQRIEITGSNIKRIDAETSTPVQVIKREEIVGLGVSSVKDLLDTLSSASKTALSDINGSNSFAGGASAASLRSLGKASTLILLNSRRVAPYALADYNEVFTNLDSLPLDAVERIEILRNGGSAVYGSDAVAGVINIITRSDYQGLQVSASREQSTRNRSFSNTKASITGGIGDLAADRYNVLANLEVFKRGSTVWRDAVDDINPTYGDYFSALKPGSGLMFGNRGAPSTYGYPGNVDNGSSLAALPGCKSVGADGLCRWDRQAGFQIQPSADRANLLVSGKFKINSDLEGFSEVLYSSTKTVYTSNPGTYGISLGSETWGNPLAGGSTTFTYRGLPAGHPLNVTGQDDAELRYRWADQPAGNTIESSQYRVLTGVNGNWGNYDWETAVGLMGSTTKTSESALSNSGFLKVVGNYDPAQTDPLFFNQPNGYRIGQTNSAAVLNTLFPLQGYDGKITQQFIDGKVSGDVATIDGRAVGMALGFDLRRESFQITPSANLLAGDIVNRGAASADASRNHSSLFTEFNLPVTKNFEVQAAGRIDKFPGFDAHFSPKLGLRFEASKQLLLRGTIEGGFRAPNLTESAESSKFAFDNGVVDPKRCTQVQALAADLRAKADAGASDAAVLNARADNITNNECSAGVPSNVRNNPDLKPEESRSLTFGFVLEPAKNASVSMDYWRIERKDEIGAKDTNELLAAEDTLKPGTVVRRSLAQDPSFTAAEQAQYGVKVGKLVSTVGQFENTAKTKTSGIDLGAAMRFGFDTSQVTLSANSTYLLELYNYFNSLNGGLGDYGDNLAGRWNHPKFVGNVAVSMKSGAFTNGLRVTYSSSTTLQDDYFDDQYTAKGCASKKWSPDVCKVDGYARLDYNFSYTGIKNLTLSAFVRNVLNSRPPLDLKGLFKDGGSQTPQNIDDVMGRTIRMTAEYKFF